MADFAVQRTNMVESQVRPSDVTDRRILRAMLEIPRDEFVPSHLKPFAYMDEALKLSKSGPNGAARELLAPRTLAKMIHLAEIGDKDVVLTVGAGTGYAAALIGRLAETVVALESDAELADTAGRTLEGQEFDNIAVVTGTLSAGYPDEGPYDAIFVDGRVEEMPAVLLDQLKDGGRLVAILGPEDYSRVTLWRRVGAHFDAQEQFVASGALLPGFEVKRQFVL